MKVQSNPFLIPAFTKDRTGGDLTMTHVDWAELLKKARAGLPSLPDGGVYGTTVDPTAPGGLEEVLGESSSALHVRMEYAASLVEYHGSYCTVHFRSSGSRAWSISEMTEEEWENLLARVDSLTGGKDVPVVLLPPDVSGQMAVNASYCEWITAKIESYMSTSDGVSRLLVDKAGNIEGLDEPEDFWEAREKRQKAYIEYVQQKQMEHLLAVAKRFAGQGSGLLEEGLLGGSLAELLLGGTML